jgi:ribose transport system ATP-binding protein
VNHVAEQRHTGAAEQSAAPGLATSAGPLLKVSNLIKHFGPVRAVDGVSFEILPGEVHALVGENGAGKSTVAKILAGAYSATSGSILFDGELFTPSSIRQARDMGVVCAFQELALVPDWTVAENLVLPSRGNGGFVTQRSLNARAAQVMGELELGHIDPQAILGSLALADRQLIEIARAISAKPRLLILDEASSALNPLGVQWLFGRVRDLQVQGVGVIYVSHRLNEIHEIADRGSVLRDGVSVSDFARGSWTDNELVSQMAGRPAGKQFPKPAIVPKGTPEIIGIEGLSSAGLNNIDFRLQAGEILGLGGLAGHGQTELLKALFGDVQARASSWRINGKNVSRLTPLSAVRNGLGYVPEDRKTEGLALEMGVGENLLTPWFRAFSWGGSIRLAQERGWIKNVLSALTVKARGPLQTAGALSGGNQQKLVFGRWLERNRKALILHDPTRGIDVRSKQELYAAMVKLAESGVGIVWFSTEVEELQNMCHRVIVLHKGTIVSELVGKQITVEAIVGAAVGKRGEVSA